MEREFWLWKEKGGDVRSIKFRAFNLKTEKMMDLEAITQLALDSSLNVRGVFVPFDEWIIVEQATGLHDMNGRDIYEGDIVAMQDCGKRHVRFYDGAFVVGEMNVWFGQTMSGTSLVIGNIHENPELLKKERP